MIDMIHDTLLPWCSYLDWEPEPSIVAVANVQHLGTRMEGHLSDPRPNVLELVRALAPTPAVGGFPASEALALIDEVEGFERGRYAGSVGWVDSAGDGTWAVALRCAEFSADRRSARLGRRRRNRRRQRTAGRAGRDPGQVPGDALGHRPAVKQGLPRGVGPVSAEGGDDGGVERGVDIDIVLDGSRRRARRRCPARRMPATSSSAVSAVPARSPNRTGDIDDVGAVRRAEQLLEGVVRQCRCLRQEREDRATVVVGHHDREVEIRERRVR